MSNTQYSNTNIELQIIEELMHLTVTAVNFEELAQRIVERCANLLDAELCTLWRLIKEDNQDKIDDGPGVPNENLFTSVNKGLGLAIVKSIIKEHGGQIWLDKEYKGGAKFVIALPLNVKRSVHDATETQTASSR